MLNDIPLMYLSSDLSDPEPLTPSDLLYGRRISGFLHPQHLVLLNLHKKDHIPSQTDEKNSRYKSHETNVRMDKYTLP